MANETGSVAVQEREADARPGTPVPERPDAPLVGVDVLPDQKCPYLAGRPPHGSYHLWPSGVNVCYARGEGEKPYGHMGKETQRSRCFCGPEVFEQCADYERAQTGGVALPVFDGTGPSMDRVSAAPLRNARRERVKRRRQRSVIKEWLQSSGRTTLVCACWVILALVSFWLVLRSM